jgi:hypothetical protein
MMPTNILESAQFIGRKGDAAHVPLPPIAVGAGMAILCLRQLAARGQ